jgi:hypothetical protein
LLEAPLFVDVPVDLWGFTIWRTVYTLGSDAKFARALDLINQWVERECFEQAKRTHTDDGVETLNHRAAREVWKRYDNIVIKDRSLEGASPDAVRQRFAAWTKEKGVGWSQQSSRYRFCILIDEEVLETLSSWFPPPPSWAGLTEQQQCSVKVIDVEIEGDDDDCYPHGYRCCLMTPPWMLAHIYHFSHNIGSDKMRDDIRGVPVYGFAKQWLSW